MNRVGEAAAIDLGKVRVGLAVADELGVMAHPRPHLDGRNVRRRAMPSGSVDLGEAVNHQGEVRLAIPGYGSGYGKMLLSIQGRSLEIEAYTRGADIGRGTRVRVVRREGSGMLFVEPMVS